jgi:hypothetical protein
LVRQRTDIRRTIAYFGLHGRDLRVPPKPSSHLQDDSPMNIDKRWVLLFALAAGTAVSAVVATNARRRHHRKLHARDLKSDIKSWENEGGNLAPAPVAAVVP